MKPFFRPLLISGLCVFLINACTPSYPKGNLEQSIRKLFKKELGTSANAKLVGKTLYVSFEIENLVSSSFELPKEVIKKLEDAMLSISRISLSTDAEIDFTVIEARDVTWGIETSIVRNMHDLKGLIYWGVSKGDFDERLVLETKKIVESESGNTHWHDITLPEYMGRLVASRITLGTRANPFLGVLLGIEGMTSNYNAENKTLTLTIQNSSQELVSSTSSLTLDLLKDSISEQISQSEKKYLVTDPKRKERLRKQSAVFLDDPAWLAEVLVEDLRKNIILRIPRKEWSSIKETH